MRASDRTRWTEEDLKAAIMRMGKMNTVRGGVVVQALQGPRPDGLLNVSAIERPQRHVDRDNPSPVPNPAPSPKREYKSKWETQYAYELTIQKAAGLITDFRYEPMSFKLSVGKRYRPDFLIQHPGGMERKLEFVEIKGLWIKNRRDGMTHLKWAAQLYPMFRWTLMWRTKQGWESENVEV